MSGKRKIQLIAIGLLLIGIFFMLPNTKWTDKSAVFGFISLTVGTLGSIASIFIPSNYSIKFDENTWEKFATEYKIEIPSTQHGMGKSPNAQVFLKRENGYELVITDIDHDSKGNISIKAGQLFIGKVVISS